jgi:hypothetical protein
VSFAGPQVLAPNRSPRGVSASVVATARVTPSSGNSLATVKSGRSSRAPVVLPLGRTSTRVAASDAQSRPPFSTSLVQPASAESRAVRKGSSGPVSALFPVVPRSPDVGPRSADCLSAASSADRRRSVHNHGNDVSSTILANARGSGRRGTSLDQARLANAEEVAKIARIPGQERSSPANSRSASRDTKAGRNVHMPLLHNSEPKATSMGGGHESRDNGLDTKSDEQDKPQRSSRGVATRASAARVREAVGVIHPGYTPQHPRKLPDVQDAQRSLAQQATSTQSRPSLAAFEARSPHMRSSSEDAKWHRKVPEQERRLRLHLEAKRAAHSATSRPHSAPDVTAIQAMTSNPHSKATRTPADMRGGIYSEPNTASHTRARDPHAKPTMPPCATSRDPHAGTSAWTSNPHLEPKRTPRGIRSGAHMQADKASHATKRDSHTEAPAATTGMRREATFAPNSGSPAVASDLHLEQTSDRAGKNDPHFDSHAGLHTLRSDSRSHRNATDLAETGSSQGELKGNPRSVNGGRAESHAAPRSARRAPRPESHEFRSGTKPETTAPSVVQSNMMMGSIADSKVGKLAAKRRASSASGYGGGGESHTLPIVQFASLQDTPFNEDHSGDSGRQWPQPVSDDSSSSVQRRPRRHAARPAIPIVHPVPIRTDETTRQRQHTRPHRSRLRVEAGVGLDSLGKVVASPVLLNHIPSATKEQPAVAVPNLGPDWRLQGWPQVQRSQKGTSRRHRHAAPIQSIDERLDGMQAHVDRVRKVLTHKPHQPP